MHSNPREAAVGRRGSPRLVRALLVAGLLIVAGCATGEVVMLATIAGGEKIRVPISRGGAAMTDEGGVQIDTASFILTADKKILYTFAFTDRKKRPLRHVLVEDVSDETPKTLVESANPQLSATGQWRADAEPMTGTDPRLKWIATISNSVRVYRFTLTFADGQKLILHQGHMCPAPMKAVVRQAFGMNY